MAKIGECGDGVKLFLTFESGLTALIEVGTWNMDTLPRWYMTGLTGAVTINDLWSCEGQITKLKMDEKNNTTPVFLAAYYAENFPVTILKPTTTYGPKRVLRQLGIDRIWVNRIRKGKPILLCGDGESDSSFPVCR